MAIKPVEILIKAKDQASSVFTSLQRVAVAAGVAIAGYFGIRLFSGAVESAEQLDVQMRKLNAVIQATGGAAGLTAQEIDDMARRLDEATTGSAEGFRDAATQLLTFKSVGKDSFETTLRLAQDLADAGFGSLSSNAVQLGKALENPVQGLSALTESGVTFTREQQNVIKLLVETGRVASAQKLILEAVAGQVGGTAEAIGGGLTGAIDLVNKRFTDLKQQLGAAVLPVFQQFNQIIADLYKRLNDSGTVQRFGEAIASGLQVAVTAFQNFISVVDFEAIGQRIGAFISQVGSSFDTLAQYATTAGNSVQLAYGVMSAGVNTVKAAVLGIGSVFAEVASVVMSGVASLRDGLATVTFGGLSASLKEAAEDARISAGAFDASAQAMRDAAESALINVADGAVMARNAWNELTTATEKSASTTASSTAVFGTMAKQLEAQADANAKAAAAQRAQAEAAEVSKQAMAKLREEYAQLIAKGDLQGAAEKLEEINKKLRETPAAADGAEQAALDVALAFKETGIQTVEELQKSAEMAKNRFEIIKASGKATAEGLRIAFQQYAEAAIAANGGVATETLKSQAAMHGLEVASDGAGGSIVRAMSSGADAAQGMTAGLVQAQQAVKELDGYLERLAKRNAEVKSSMITDEQGFSADAGGNRIAMGGDLNTLTGISNFLRQAGLDREQAKSVAREFADSQGNVQYFNNPGQIKYGGAESTLSQALLKAAERITFGAGGSGGAASVGKTVRVEWNTPKGREVFDTDEKGAEAFVRGLQSAARSAGR